MRDLKTLCLVTAAGVALASAASAQSIAPGAPGDAPTWSTAAKTGAGASYEAYVDGQYGVDGLYVGVPVQIGANGVEKVIEIDLDDEAKTNFQVSVDAVKELLDACKGIDGSLA